VPGQEVIGGGKIKGRGHLAIVCASISSPGKMGIEHATEATHLGKKRGEEAGRRAPNVDGLKVKKSGRDKAQTKNSDRQTRRGILGMILCFWLRDWGVRDGRSCKTGNVINLRISRGMKGRERKESARVFSNNNREYTPWVPYWGSR